MLSTTGEVLIRSVHTAGRAVHLLSQSFWQISTLRLSMRQLLRHLDTAAVGSLGVLALIAALTGMIMVMQTGPSLEPYGVIDVIGGYRWRQLHARNGSVMGCHYNARTGWLGDGCRIGYDGCE